MAQSGEVVAKTHQVLREAAKPGTTTGDLDALAHKTVLDLGGKPNFLNYHGFPATVCISVNEEVVHGIPGGRELRLGDVVSFDSGATTSHKGEAWHADGAFTMIVGDDGDLESTAALEAAVGPEELAVRRDLLKVTEEAMWRGIAGFAKGRRIGDIGAAIEDYVEGVSDEVEWDPQLVEGYTGHGIGRSLHEPPTVYNYRTRGRNPWIRKGMTVCIEPMVTAGPAPTKVLRDDWTVVTRVGSLAAHFEQTVARVDGGVAVLTAPDGGAAALKRLGVTPVHVGRDFANLRR